MPPLFQGVPVATSKAAGNNRMGTAALDSNGTVTISTKAVKTGSLILVWYVAPDGVFGGVLLADPADITDKTSFVIRSYLASEADPDLPPAATADTSTVGWMILS